MEQIKNIMFICTGNTCRSAMAEGLMKKMLEDKGITNIKVCSAGLRASTGEYSTDEAIMVMKEDYDVNLLNHQSGRNLDYALSLEGSLKLKEISYIHSEAYASGELKHGTISLIRQGTPVIAVAAYLPLLDKAVSNVVEVQARGARVLALTTEAGAEALHKRVDTVLTVPEAEAMLLPQLGVIPLQLLSYYTALERGCDIDKPRNLAKSVTVE